MTMIAEAKLPAARAAKLQAVARPAAPHVAPCPLTGNESDNELDEMRVARYLLAKYDPADHHEDLSDKPPAVRRFLSRINMADNCWIRSPLLSDLPETDLSWPPHDFVPRSREQREAHGNPDESLEARRAIAFDYICEATEELREFLVSNDWENNRLVHAVATAMRAELRRLVAYVDAGCPLDYGVED